MRIGGVPARHAAEINRNAEALHGGAERVHFLPPSWRRC